MAPSTNGTAKLGLRDLVEDILIIILVESNVPGVLALSRTNKYLRRIALTRAVWYSLVSRLVQRGFIDSRPDDGYFKDLSTEQLIGLVRRMLHGPKAWTDTPSQSQSFPNPRSQTAVRRAVNRFRKFIRKPPLGGLASAPLVESRRIVLHHPEIDTAPGGLPEWHVNRPKLLPGGKYVLFRNSGRVECWSVFEDRHIWTHTPSMDHTLVHNFEVDMLEDDVAIISTCQLTGPQPKPFVEITSLNLQTGVSDLELVSRLPELPEHDFRFVDCVVCGDVVAVHLRPENQVLLINWRTSSRVVVSGYKSETALVPGYLVVLTRTGTRGEHRVALSPFASFACWEPNDSVEQPSAPVVPVADLPFLPGTISLTCELYYTWKRSIWVYESPFQRGRFTFWLHALVNSTPALLSYEFLKHDTGVSWRFVASTPMPDHIYPTAVSLSGHTLGHCTDYAGYGIIAPFPVSKGSARRHIVDFGIPSIHHLPPFSGALTHLTLTELTVVYYD
ncbi:hypothetical protein DFH08DRAFT_35860 [Mycena albidolilacea]|uniref:F-box domain-containing protein n=1 Tax=Mycena albidolilacea TaxID=1033008 RepID=A0AAD7AVR6_9AGAR|nr:hypothetical protein DFH08DRAFT_35860 [Mycena albidolilacea]